MKRIKKYWSLVLLVTVLSCNKNGSGNSDPKPPIVDNNIIKNAGFETGGATSTPANWQTEGDADADFTESGAVYGTYSLTQKKNSNYHVYTFQNISGLANGIYTLTAWVQNSGGQNACYLSAKDYGGVERMTSLPVATTSWIIVTVRGIQVTNGQCKIGLYSDANNGDWCKMDNLNIVKDDKPYSFLKGGDLSELTYVEQNGGKFYENGVQKDCFEILKNNGFNLARLRLYNDPGNPAYTPSKRLPPGIQNPADILHLARRAKDAGMQIQLTFHYSDYWTNGATQNKPHEWAALNYTDLKQAVYDFTFNFMTQMKNQGTTPEYVSLGNETAGGILFPDGDYTNFTKMAELFNKGYEAVKAVSPITKVIIHLDDAGNASKYDWYYGELNAKGAKYDVIGASYYPFWTNKTVQQIMDWATYQSNKFDKDIMIMETGYNWSSALPNGTHGQLSNNGPYTAQYPSTPEGQKNFLYDCFNGLKSGANGRVIGDIYWDPVMIAVPGVGWELGAPNVVSNTTLFDFNGNMLSSLKAYKYNN